MKSIPAVVLALLLLPLDPSAPLHEPVPSTLAVPVAPVGQPTAFDTVMVRVPSSTTDTRSNLRPRWPEGWPSLDLSPALVGPGSADEVQAMGVGELDLVLKGTGADPAADRQVAVEADPAEVGGRRTGTLSGTVVDTNGEPLSGVRVTLAGAEGEPEDARTGDAVTFRLADGTEGVDVTLIDRGEPRRLGTTGEGGVTRVPAEEVEDGTALIAYAVDCGEDKQIVLVRPEDEEAFLDAYGDCAGRRVERFAWYAGDVLVDVRGLARWIPYPPEAPQISDEPDQVMGDEGEAAGEEPDEQGVEESGADDEDIDGRDETEEPVIHGDAVTFGAYLPDKQGSPFLAPRFDLPGTHTFAVTIRGASWIKPAQEKVEISGDGLVGGGLDNIVDFKIDTSDLAPGHHSGTLILTCEGCETPHVIEIPISIDVVFPTTFGSHPADQKFGGLDKQGQPRPIRDLLGHVIDEIEGSSFGQHPNGPAIIGTLRDWIDDIIILPSVDSPTAEGMPKAPGPSPGKTDDGDQIRPGEGQYQYIPLYVDLGYWHSSLPRFQYWSSEEFYLGVDLSTQGIEEARKNPDDYYVFTLDGQMGVVRKDDLAHTLPHEGLHAHHAGAYNIPDEGASNQEERDGFRAGNMAAEALGLPAQTDKPSYGGSNPDYEPLFPPEEPPSSEPSSQASIDPVTSPGALGGPSGRGGGASEIEVVIRSTGGSTGAVLELYAVNHGEEPVRIRTDGLVLERLNQDELTPETRARLNAIIEAASSGKPVPSPSVPGSPRGGGGGGGSGEPNDRAHGPNPGAGTWSAASRRSLPGMPREAEVVTVVLDGYCLEFAKDVPLEGMLFRIADREAQQEAARFREIIGASRRLQELGKLHPDGDPESYFHSTRQWAAWADELELDRDGFEEAFVKHARRNFDAAGRPWSGEVEEQVRALVPNRWADLTAVLDEAERSIRRPR